MAKVHVLIFLFCTFGLSVSISSLASQSQFGSAASESSSSAESASSINQPWQMLSPVSSSDQAQNAAQSPGPGLVSSSSFSPQSVNSSPSQTGFSGDFQNLSSSTQPDGQFSSSVSLFSSAFFQGASSSDLFGKLFDVSAHSVATPQEYYDGILFLAQQMGVSEPDTLARAVSESMSNGFKNLTPAQYFTAVSNTMERFLGKYNLLTPYNLEALVDSFLKSKSSAMEGVLNTNMALNVLNTLNSFGDLPTNAYEEIIYTFLEEINKFQNFNSIP